MKYILPPCGQSTDYPHFLYPFPTGTFPETPAVRGMADCISLKELLETRTSVPQDELAIPLPFPPAWSVH